MPSQQGNFLNVIDVGSAKTCALVAEITENGLRYRGHGLSDSRGSRKGVIVDLAGAAVEHALVGVAGSHVRGLNTHGGITFGTRPREIAREEIRLAVDKARAIPLPADREVLHLLPQEFILDEQAGVHDPLGMMAARLEVRVHMVTSASSATQNVVSAVNRAGVHVDDTVFEPLACADAVLRSDERDMGVCLADIGAGSTELAIFHQGAVAYTGVIPIGGDHFTSDLSVGLCTPVNEAEILEPRARELCELLREAMRQSGMFDACLAGLVLSGGGSRLPGLLDIADSVLRKPVRLSWPIPLAKMPIELAEPEFATALGLVYYGHRARVARGFQNDRWSSRLKAMFAKKGA